MPPALGGGGEICWEGKLRAPVEILNAALFRREALAKDGAGDGAGDAKKGGLSFEKKARFGVETDMRFKRMLMPEARFVAAVPVVTS